MDATRTVTGERGDFLKSLAKHRGFLRQTVRDLTDDQARQRTTVSELTLGGLIKHVSATERKWADFIVEGPAVFGDVTEFTAADLEARVNEFKLLEGETLAGALAAYEETAARTDALVESLPDLDAAQPLPSAPWFESGAAWSARLVLLHIVAETSQHAGHADILREALDGAKTMG